MVSLSTPHSKSHVWMTVVSPSMGAIVTAPNMHTHTRIQIYTLTPHRTPCAYRAPNILTNNHKTYQLVNWSRPHATVCCEVSLNGGFERSGVYRRERWNRESVKLSPKHAGFGAIERKQWSVGVKVCIGRIKIRLKATVKYFIGEIGHVNKVME